MLSPCADTATSSDWRQVLHDRLPLFGHRNWIVVADSAYPAQSNSGIETVVSNADQIDVLREVLAQITSSIHVRPMILLDRELHFLTDFDAKGMDAYREKLNSIVPAGQFTSLPHEQIISKLDEASNVFKVLIIKTNMTIPYTSVFIQLNCGYWSDESEQRLRAAMKR